MQHLIAACLTAVQQSNDSNLLAKGIDLMNAVVGGCLLNDFAVATAKNHNRSNVYGSTLKSEYFDWTRCIQEFFFG